MNSIPDLRVILIDDNEIDLMLHEKLNAVRIFSFVMAVAGVLLTSLTDIQGANFGQRTYVIGNLLFLVACAASAFYNTYCKFLVDRNYTELEILIYTSIVGSVASVPLFVWLEPQAWKALLHMDRVAFLGLLELAFIVYGLAMLLFFYVLKRLDVTQATLGNYLLPFFIGLLAVAVLKESITASMWIGGAVVLLSTLLVTVYENEILNWLRQRRRLENVQNTGP